MAKGIVCKEKGKKMNWVAYVEWTNGKQRQHDVTGCGVIEHPPDSDHWVSASGADLLLKGSSN